MRLAKKESHSLQEHPQDEDEEEQTPAGTDPVAAEKNLVKPRWFGWRGLRE